MKMEKRNRGSIAATTAIAAVLVLGAVAPAAADDVRRAKTDAGMGLATVVANIFYIPVKVGYAAVGSITGGLAYALTAGNKDAAQRVWVSSVGGDYVLTSDMVSGQQKIHFSGTTDPDL
jgi:hypothetical protein